MSIEEATAELAAFLNGTKASTVETQHDTVIEVNSSMTPTEASKLLWKEHIIGAPVWDEQQKKYVGCFDMRDLISTVLASHKEEVSKKQGNKEHMFTKWFLKKTESQKSNFTVSYLAARNPFVSLTEEATLMEVLKLCAKRHCHRVPIVDSKTGRCVRILSQSALVKFLVEHMLADSKSANIKKFFGRTLGEAGLPYKKEVMSAPDTSTASEVFELMDNKRLSGIAVVDQSDGALIGNTSASDIKLACECSDEDEGGAVADLDLNIMSFLSAVRQEDPTKEAKYPSSHVKESSTLGHAIKLLAKTGYHRVFVCDEEVKPVGVVSVTDIVTYLAEQ